VRLITAIALLLVFAGAPVCAQQGPTISPVIVEYKEKGRGRFEVQNNTVVPLNVVLEPRSFSVDEQGRPHFRPLDAGIHIKLSAMSFRLAPRQTFSVFYEASAEKMPAWFTVYAMVTGATTPEGIKLVIELPHTIYLLPGQPMQQESVQFLRAAASADAKTIEAEVENRSAEFDRVLEVEVTSRAGKETYPGFPLFPGQKRILQLPWDKKESPAKVVLKFAKFSVEETVRPASETP